MSGAEENVGEVAKPASHDSFSPTNPGPVLRGHEGFVQPSSFLRPLAHQVQLGQATALQPLSAIDREQKQGLVSRTML